MFNLLFILSFFIFINSFAFAEEQWEDVGQSVLMFGVNQAVVMSSQEVEGHVLLGINNRIYETKDKGYYWREIKRFKENVVDIKAGDRDYFIVTTKRELFILKGRGFDRLFKIRNANEEILCVWLDLEDTNKILVGTNNGLYISLDCGQAWEKNISVNNVTVFKIVQNRNGFFLLTNKGIMKVKEIKEPVETIYQWKVQTKEIQEEDNVVVAGEVEDDQNRRLIDFCTDGNSLYVVTNKEFLQSKNCKFFESICLKGLPKLSFVKGIVFSDKLYALTDKGLFSYDEGKSLWEEKYNGFKTKTMLDGYFNEFGDFFVVSEDSVYVLIKTDDPDFSMKELEELNKNFDHEPTIREVQLRVVEYGEVNKSKIDEWRKKANKQALLPTMTVGYGLSQDETYEIYTSATTHYNVTGPETRQRDWDIGMSWKLGELIWNESQLSIDNRSKLMVQLRDDLLSEVTRIYYERKREQIELFLHKDKAYSKRIGKMLRIEELTSNIDGLTNGWFSREIERRLKAKRLLPKKDKEC